MLRGLQSGYVAELPADIEDRVLPAGPKGQVSIRIVRPRAAKGTLPAVMYFHGGGWVLGDKDTHDRLIREIANGAAAAVVFVNYTPSPEARYPVAIEQAYAATEWVAEHGERSTWTLPPGRRRRQRRRQHGRGRHAAGQGRGGPEIRFQVLFYPVTDAGFDTPSYNQFAEGHLLTRDAMKWFWDRVRPRRRRSGTSRPRRRCGRPWSNCGACPRP